jgi:GT2 family glycosyltransferase
MRQCVKIAVGIATAGRREILAEALSELSRQIRLPDKVFVCPAAEEDFDHGRAAELPVPVVAVGSPRGLPAQRNAILDAARGFEVLVFLDDDFFASPAYFAGVERSFAAHSAVVAMTGRVIADGVTGPGLSVESARAALASFAASTGDDSLKDLYNAYGCNMAVRLSAVHSHGLRFDENLPLYGWLEDVDFSRQLAPYGRIVRNDSLIGVHLGHKGGRTSGVRTGYSQVANPLYLWRKGTLRLDRALFQMTRNILANFGNVIRPEPWVDRRGRVRGNVLGFLDLIRGRLHPRGILDLH